MVILYYLLVSFISSQNGREEIISSILEKPSFYHDYYHPWKKHANPALIRVELLDQML